jgi:UDPglucose 6-dehydrogenase
MKNQTIAVVGLWHLGCVTSACLSSISKFVIGYDPDEKIINDLNKGITPIYEPFLKDKIKEGVKSGSLKFTSDFNEIENADYIWITFDTPINSKNECQLSIIFDTVQSLSKKKNGYNFIISSQVPTGTCDRILNIFPKEQKVNIAYVPENLQLGNAIEQFMNPDVWVIGSNCLKYAQEIKRLLNKISNNPVICDVRTAEFAKHAINSFLATSISFSNELSDLAVSMNANYYTVVDIMKKDNRIGSKLPLFPGPWFSGGTLARDLMSLKYIATRNHVTSTLINSTLYINKTRIKELFNRVEDLYPLKESSVSIIGIIYKENTNTLRQSPGIQIVNYLNKLGVRNIYLYDTLINQKQINVSNATLYENIIEAIEPTQIVVILRKGCIKEVSEDEFYNSLAGKVVLDMWNIINDDKIREHNINCIKPGRLI